RGHLERLAVKVEVVDVDRSEIDLQGFGNRADRDIHALRLRAVDVDVKLRGFRTVEAEHAFPFRFAGAALDQIADGVLKADGVAALAVLDHHFHAAGRAEAADGGRGKGEHAGFLDFRELGGNVGDDAIE